MATENRRYYFRVVDPSVPSAEPSSFNIVQTDAPSLVRAVHNLAETMDGLDPDHLVYIGDTAPDVAFMAAHSRECAVCGLRGERLVMGLRPDMFPSGLCVDCAKLHFEREEKRFVAWASAVSEFLHKAGVLDDGCTPPETHDEVTMLLTEAVAALVKKGLDVGCHQEQEGEAVQAG